MKALSLGLPELETYAMEMRLGVKLEMNSLPLLPLIVKQFSKLQIIAILKAVETERTVKDVCRSTRSAKINGNRNPSRTVIFVHVLVALSEPLASGNSRSVTSHAEGAP
jgi:hypothetical protein